VRALRYALAGAAVPLAVIAYRVQVDNLHSPWQRAAATVAIGLAFVGAGLLAWGRRPQSRLGLLMVAAGYALLLRQFRYSHDALLFTVFFALGDLWYVLVGHAALAYPAGRVRGRVEQSGVRIAYAAVLALPLAVLVFYDGQRPLRTFHSVSPSSLLLVDGDEGVVSALQTSLIAVYAAIGLAFVVLVGRKLALATPRARRQLLPLMLAAVAIALRALFECLRAFVDPVVASDYLFWWQVIVLLALPVALLAGLLRARLARSSVGELLLALERTPADGLEAALARALGDPTLELAFWVPARRAYIDASGADVELPETPGRAVTTLEHEGRPLAVLVHDATLLDEPQLIEAVGAAARLTLENARLNAELSAQLAAVKESRARIVAAADEERRRIERNIHDGAQQRLVALGLDLRGAQRRLGLGDDDEAGAVLDAAARELQVAVEELRELARGVHPAILTEEGLVVALESLARRAPLIVAVDGGTSERMAPEVEATAYFVASEALANVVKHAHARHAEIGVARRNGSVVIGITDDGIGGAVPAPGSGLSGLNDRVEALGGSLSIESLPAGGTRVQAVIPCAS
jgi:signal transduction histidine kinase